MPTQEAQATSEVIRDVLHVCKVSAEQIPWPGPGIDRERDWGPYTPDLKLVRAAADDLVERSTGSLVLLVGNDPFISWVLRDLLSRGRWSARAAPIARTELLCLQPSRHGTTRWDLAWNIAPNEVPNEGPVREKVAEKMSATTGLGAVVVALLTFLLEGKTEMSGWHWVALAALLASAVLYFSALFLYDSLRMPTRFWVSGSPPGAERRTVPNRLRHGRAGLARPPSSMARVLQVAMVQVWTWVFFPATVLLVGGLTALVLAQAANAAPVALQAWQLAWGVFVVVGASAGWVAVHRPNLGASD